MGIFKLNKEVSETTDDIDPDDVMKVKTNLKDLGYYKTPDYGMTKFGDTQMFEGLRKMQKEKGLSVDGIAKPQGETEGMFNQLLKDRQPQNGSTVQKATQAPQQTSFQKDMEFRRRNLLNGELKTAGNQESRTENNIMKKANTVFANGANGYSLGTIDEITGAINGTGMLIASPITKEKPIEAFKKGYIQQRDLTRNYIKDAHKDNPSLGIASEVAGAIASPVRFFKTVKTAPLAVKTNTALKNATTNGALYGFSDSEGNLKNRTEDSVIGAATSLAGHNIAKGINKNITVGFTNDRLNNIYNNSLEYGFSNLLEGAIKGKTEKKKD